MSKILRRPMFRGGGTVSSYGNGIATGLADGGMAGKRGLVDGPGGYAGVDTRTYDRFKGFNSGQPVTQSDFLNFLNAQSGSQVGPVITGGEISEEAMEKFKTPRYFEKNIEVDDSTSLDEETNERTYDEDQLNFPVLKYKDTVTGGLGAIAKDNKTLANLLSDQLKMDAPPAMTETTIQDSIIDKGELYESPTMTMKQNEMNEVPAGVIKLNQNPEEPEVGVQDLIQTNSDMFNEMLTAGTKERNEKRLKKARITDLSNLGLDLFAKSTKEGATVRSMFGEAAENLASKPSKTEKLLDKQDDNEDKIKQAAAMLGIKGEQAQKLYETKLKNKDSSGQTEKAVRYISSITGKDAKDALKDYLREDTSFAETVGKYKKSEGALTAQGFGLAAEDFYEGLYIDDIPTDGNVKKGDTAPGKENGIYTDNKNLILFEIKDEVIISSRNYS